MLLNSQAFRKPITHIKTFPSADLPALQTPPPRASDNETQLGLSRDHVYLQLIIYGSQLDDRGVSIFFSEHVA
jgi:hypothetical protein